MTGTKWKVETYLYKSAFELGRNKNQSWSVDGQMITWWMAGRG